MQVISIFRRVRAPRRHNDDGNPLIYALKGSRGYSIDLKSVALLSRDCRRIITKAKQHLSCDLIVPIPSSSNVVTGFVKRVKWSLGVRVETRLFQKKANHQVCAEIDARLRAGGLSSKKVDHLTLAREQLMKASAASFAMKNVAPAIRKYFSPFELKNRHLLLPTTRVLLVDDLLSSGTSLASAAELLRATGVGSVTFLTLLSSTEPARTL